MPRKRKGKKSSPERPQSSEWVERNAELLSAWSAFPKTHDAAQAEVTQRLMMGVEYEMRGGGTEEEMMTAMDAATHGPAAGEPAEYPLHHVRLVNQQVHRSLGEGLLVTGFEPQRHSTMVLGRPVQAAGSDNCVHHFCMLWCRFFVS